MVKPIIEISRATGAYTTCNACGKSVDKGHEVHEIKLGIELPGRSQSTTVCLCTDCLDKLVDVLWQYQGELS